MAVSDTISFIVDSLLKSISGIVANMSNSGLRVRNRGAYSQPFSGVGIEFFPLGMPPDHTGLILYESGYLPQNDWWDFPNTLSPFWRLYYNSREGHRVIFPNRTIELTPEHMVLISDHQLFHTQGSEPVPHFWLAFNVARRLMPNQQIPIVMAPGRTERSLLEDLAELYAEDSGERNRDRIFHGSMALLHLALNRPEIEWQGNTPPAVVQTVRYIEEHYAAPLFIPRLARMANLCTEGLARSFKKYQGVTIGRFIVNVRVRQAAHLLIHTDTPIETVAETTGFPNRAYLSRVFKKTTGESPAQFRRRHSMHPTAPHDDTLAT